jgi:hypothetical protein
MTPGEHHASDSGADEREGPGRTGLGALLRNKRGKRGLSLSQVSEMTRLRPYILEALEEEDWGQLPAPVFVKGFIRSYARALGLEEEKAVSLFPELAPADVAPPKPLVAPTKSRWRLSFLTVGLLVVLAVLYYLWGEWSERSRVGLPPESIFTEVESGDTDEGTEEAAALSPTPEGRVAESDTAGKESPATGAADDISPHVMGPFFPEAEPELAGLPLALKAHVFERTWVRIYLDDKEPKEYIFRPGSHPEWRASRGFDVLVGNAAGIIFEFQGKMLEPPGDRGQVVRLRFPEGYERPATQSPEG